MPLAIDLFCGLGGWTDGFLAEGYTVVGFDVEEHAYGEQRYGGHLVLQDVLTIHGKQFKNATIIVASPPCQEYSYMAMPWSKAKAKAKAYRDQPETQASLTALFRACFRIQAEASAAAGRYIPLVVENVKGAQPWVGRAQWNYGSYYLWGDVPALMPTVIKAQKFNPDGTAHGVGSWFAVANSKNRGASVAGDGFKNPGFRFDGSGKSFQSESVERATKNEGGSWFNVGSPGQTVVNKNPTRGMSRKAASARIAMIPLALARHIARTYYPAEV